MIERAITVRRWTKLGLEFQNKHTKMSIFLKLKRFQSLQQADRQCESGLGPEE